MVSCSIIPYCSCFIFCPCVLSVLPSGSRRYSILFLLFFLSLCFSWREPSLFHTILALYFVLVFSVFFLAGAVVPLIIICLVVIAVRVRTRSRREARMYSAEKGNQASSASFPGPSILVGFFHAKECLGSALTSDSSSLCARDPSATKYHFPCAEKAQGIAMMCFFVCKDLLFVCNELLFAFAQCRDLISFFSFFTK